MIRRLWPFQLAFEAPFLLFWSHFCRPLHQKLQMRNGVAWCLYSCKSGLTLLWELFASSWSPFKTRNHANDGSGLSIEHRHHSDVAPEQRGFRSLVVFLNPTIIGNRQYVLPRWKVGSHHFSKNVHNPGCPQLLVVILFELDLQSSGLSSGYHQTRSRGAKFLLPSLQPLSA